MKGTIVRQHHYNKSDSEFYISGIHLPNAIWSFFYFVTSKSCKLLQILQQGNETSVMSMVGTVAPRQGYGSFMVVVTYTRAPQKAQLWLLHRRNHIHEILFTAIVLFFLLTGVTYKLMYTYISPSGLYIWRRNMAEAFEGFDNQK